MSGSAAGDCSSGLEWSVDFLTGGGWSAGAVPAAFFLFRALVASVRDLARDLGLVVLEDGAEPLAFSFLGLLQGWGVLSWAGAGAECTVGAGGRTAARGVRVLTAGRV